MTPIIKQQTKNARLYAMHYQLAFKNKEINCNFTLVIKKTGLHERTLSILRFKFDLTRGESICYFRVFIDQNIACLLSVLHRQKTDGSNKNSKAYFIT